MIKDSCYMYLVFRSKKLVFRADDLVSGLELMVYKTVYPAGNYILRVNYRNAGLIGGVCCKVSNQGSKTVSVESSVFAFNFQHMP